MGERLQELARRRAPEAEAGEPRRHVLDQHGAVVRRMRADPGGVVLPEGRAGDDAEAVLGEPGDGEIALDPAALVEHLRVRDRADVTRDAVVAEPLEERRPHPDRRPRAWRRTSRRRARPPRGRRGARRRSPATTGAPPTRAAAATRRRARRSARTSSRAPSRTSRRRRRRAPAGARRRARAAGPPGLALVARVLDVVVGRVDLDGARERVGLARVGRAEAARVHLPDVQARHALDDPLGHEPPHAARAGEAVGAEARGHPEAADVGLAEDELTVRRERLGPVDELHDLGLLELGDAYERRSSSAPRSAPSPREEAVR